MIVEALGRKDTKPDQEATRPSFAGLIATAIGTSIDAAAVGVTLAFLNANILVIALAIGLATFSMSTVGMLIGRAVSARFGSVVELLGGAGLIAIGTKILLEHTGAIG